MKSFKINLLVGLVVTAISAPSMAETTQNTRARVAKDQTKAQGKLAKGRRVASRSPQSVSDVRAQGQVPQVKEKEWDLSIGILAGYAQATSSDNSAQVLRDQGHYNRNGYGGLNVDFHFKKFAGLEAEGFFGTGQDAASTKVDRISGTISQGTRKLQQYGGMAAIKGQLPIAVGRGWITPKAGIGYGMLTVNEKATDTVSGDESESKVELKAPYGLIGVDSEIIPKVIISGDFAMSFGANGTTATSTAGSTTPTELDTTTAQFYRIRAGLYYRFTRSFTAGAQYNRRQLKYTGAGSSAEVTESLDQYLGVLAVNF